jgi:hypothetical protein
VAAHAALSAAPAPPSAAGLTIAVAIGTCLPFVITMSTTRVMAAKCASIVSIAGGDAVKRRGPAKVQKPVDNSLVAPKPRDLLIDVIKVEIC